MKDLRNTWVNFIRWEQTILVFTSFFILIGVIGYIIVVIAEYSGLLEGFYPQPINDALLIFQGWLGFIAVFSMVNLIVHSALLTKKIILKKGNE